MASQLSRVEGHVHEIDSRLVRVEEKVDLIGSKVDRLCALLEGDGSEDRPGIIKDVDRLKQSENRRKWVLGAVITGLITLAGERVSAFFR